MAASPGKASPARACAYEVIRRVFEQGAYADRALHARSRGLDARERALAMALTYGTVQRRATLDHVAAKLVDRPLERLDPAVLAALRLGLIQLLFLDGIAPHAAVNESVALLKARNPGAAGLVNAVLRRAVREGAGIVSELRDDSPSGAAIKHSVPEWLARRWWAELGAEEARALLAVVNQPAESALRVNTLRATVDGVRAELPVPVHGAAGLPEGLVLERAFDAHGSDLWRRGAIMPQSRGSMLVVRVLAPSPGQSLLDLCAAPGGKTTHLAALGAREVIAVERHPGRARALQATCERMGASVIRVEVADAAAAGTERAPAALAPGVSFDGVLVDPPCSGLGTLQSRPDLRWHASEESIDQLSAVQWEILAAGARLTRPGGTLVYSVCTISRAEGPEVVERFLAANDEFTAQALAVRHPEYAAAAVGPYLQLMPHRDGTDGFFIACFTRKRG